MTNNYQKSLSNTSDTVENLIEIGIALTTAEKKEIYHFRYQIYAEEMSKHLEDMDYDNELLHDELDEWTFLLYAKIGSRIIGTARINIGTIADFPEKVVDILAMKTFQNFINDYDNHKFAYVTKLMVAPAHRSSSVLYLLIARCYELCYLNQVQFAFGGCNFHLLRLYEQIGFHRYGKNFVYPGYGLLAPIVLVVNDIQHLRIVRSPLFRIARKRKAITISAVEWFHTKFTKHSPVINSQLVDENELWSILCNKLDSPPIEAITILHELSSTEAKKFLHYCGIYIQCDEGDTITVQGDISYAYNILISGKLKSLTFHHPVKEFTLPGQYFGANGLTEHTKHAEDIIAIDPTEILVLSGMAFPRFYNAYPDIAHKIVRTINSNGNKFPSIK